MFNRKDLLQMKEKGIPVKTIGAQLKHFRNGFPYAHLVAPATVMNGIHHFAEGEPEKLADYYKEKSKERSLLKFVPASGAATRMFKHLYSFRDIYDGSEAQYSEYISDQTFNSMYRFFSEIQLFAFYEDLRDAMNANGLDIQECIRKKDFLTVLDYLLNDIGLGYGSMPKALIKFHRYKDGSRYAFEEHLIEGVNYCKTHDNKVLIHFTVSPEHLEKFQHAVRHLTGTYKKNFGVDFNISFSLQKSSTDVIAVDTDNEPLRDPDGRLVFRPGGHGALLENLQDLNGDIIFIKNIDNVFPDRLKQPTFLYKRVLAGHLIRLQEQTFAYLKLLEKVKSGADKINEITEFASDQLLILIEDEFLNFSISQQVRYLYRKLNRPVRVCGMVRNEGEPGGGPFWVKNTKGETSLQIVEASQIDMDNQRQHDIFKAATHFNPVDLVCGVRDYLGNNFDLKKFVDPSTGFISTKSKDGKSLKAQELPGLWNGAMADWITVFIEVPIITFNPVKTVNDLLRKEHQ